MQWWVDAILSVASMSWGVIKKQKDRRTSYRHCRNLAIVSTVPVWHRALQRSNSSDSWLVGPRPKQCQSYRYRRVIDLRVTITVTKLRKVRCVEKFRECVYVLWCSMFNTLPLPAPWTSFRWRGGCMLSVFVCWYCAPSGVASFLQWWGTGDLRDILHTYALLFAIR